MIESVSIDFSLTNVWASWRAFRRGKRPSSDIQSFEYYLEDNLRILSEELDAGRYQPGSYRTFIVTDNKRRKISVAPVRDRVVHRLLYDYLVPVFDRTFAYDAWSCRKGKGLISAIERAQGFLSRYPTAHVWRSDVSKFFESVDHDVLLRLLQRHIKFGKAIKLLELMVYGHGSTIKVKAEGVGIPIGNLTSQIFANVYLNEFDRFVGHVLKPLGYVRYGDDFILVVPGKKEAEEVRIRATSYISEALKLKSNPKNDIIVKARQGIHFLGLEIFPKGRRINDRGMRRVAIRLNVTNVSSYWGLIHRYFNRKVIRSFDWAVLERLNTWNNIVESIW